MKAISVKEPWISMIAEGKKTIETRPWNTRHRGDILFVGSLRPKGEYSGKAACIAEIVDCRPMVPADEQRAKCAAYPKAYSWVLRNIRKVKPVPIKGRLRIYEVPDEIIEPV